MDTKPLTAQSPEVLAWLDRVQAIVDKNWQDHFSNIPRTILSLEEGSKFIRVVEFNGTQRMVYCFLATCDNNTKFLGVIKRGDVMKAATFKAPARHARANLFDSTLGMGCVNPYGVSYLR